ncbi:hypothetical protein M9Y60_32620, partial [Pseudomonas aeruginosa]|uniref:hypothetical protein n=1 Tax=Pseudomonas aeruginosa TaxID=287 RepID=UPI003DA13658|nr:hypothetical protein [Pseudomonas aeruginosa]
MNTQDLAKLRSIVPEMRRVRHIHFVGIGGARLRVTLGVVAKEGIQNRGAALVGQPVIQKALPRSPRYYFLLYPEKMRDYSAGVAFCLI